MSTYRDRHTHLVKQIEKTATWQQEPEHEARHLLETVQELTQVIYDPFSVQLVVNIHAMTEAFLDHYGLWDETR